MRSITRRRFLSTALVSGGAVAFGGMVYGDATKAVTNGKLLGKLDFLEEFPQEFNNPFGLGLDGRLITDLSELSSDALIIPNEHFYIRTRTPDQIDWTKPWSVSVEGLVNRRREFQMSELLDMAEPQGEVLLECSGNNRRNRSFGLLSAAEWDGVPLSTLLNQIDAKSNGARVLINGFDQHAEQPRGSVMGASWIFSFEQLEQSGAFLATHMNGEPLPRDHGFPVRLIVPGWYGCCCIKWVDRIELVEDSAPATSQMLEFSTRTHQGGRHPLAKDYIPATMDQAAMPVRIEKWSVDGKITYSICGVMWGGDKRTTDLLIRFNQDEDYVPVQHESGQSHNNTWGLWAHTWTPKAPGRHDITLKVGDPGIRTRRLDVDYYRRSVEIAEI